VKINQFLAFIGVVVFVQCSFSVSSQMVLTLEAGQQTTTVQCMEEGVAAAYISDNGGESDNYNYPANSVNLLGLCPSSVGSQINFSLFELGMCQSSSPIGNVEDVFFVFDGTVDELNVVMGNTLASATAYLNSAPSSLLFSSIGIIDFIDPITFVPGESNTSGCLTIGVISSGLCSGPNSFGFVSTASCVGGMLPFCSTALTQVQVGTCDGVNNTFAVQIDYSSTQTLGNDSVVVELDGEVVDTIELPSGDGFFDLPNIQADGMTHTVFISYLTSSNCSAQIQFQAPGSCICEAFPGSMVNAISSDVICDGEIAQ
jgi:hypothetical protein